MEQYNESLRDLFFEVLGELSIQEIITNDELMRRSESISILLRT